MVIGDVIGEGIIGLGLWVVASPKEDGGVVVLWKDLVVVVVLEKVKEMVVCMEEYWSCCGINGDGGRKR